MGSQSTTRQKNAKKNGEECTKEGSHPKMIKDMMKIRPVFSRDYLEASHEAGEVYGMCILSLNKTEAVSPSGQGTKLEIWWFQVQAHYPATHWFCSQLP